MSASKSVSNWTRATRRAWLLNFSAPVNPTISTEPGKLRMVFKRDPVVSPGSQSISFDNKVITQASYSENNGDAELDVAANQPLMASFSNNRRTIVVSAVPHRHRASDGITARVGEHWVQTGGQQRPVPTRAGQNPRRPRPRASRQQHR